MDKEYCISLKAGEYRENPNLEPLQEYQGTSIPMKVRCRLCGEIIEKTPSYMLRGHSCHECKGNKDKKA